MGCGASKAPPSDEQPPPMEHRPSKEDTIEAVAIVVFQLIDVNEDGTIDIGEARKILTTIETEENARDFISTYDLDRSGMITQDEWVTYFSSMAESIGYSDALRLLKGLVQDIRDKESSCEPSTKA
ncbi:hypothetical protein AB1Y20_001437 [Prymnesium parvum]|uniref:EF-hand domain-containing protein n=1 Tax=Prymnesium parvum TaxID=97485 RepID=A0AB34KCJ9_PRYPA